MKTVIILRGVPGNGKSTVADYIETLAVTSSSRSATICCADDYFIDDNGDYVYDRNKIHLAHEWCQKLFKCSLDIADDLIIVANTSTREKDVNTYRNMAIEYGYIVFVMTVENWHNGKDVHNVPEDVKDNMRNQLKQSIKL